MNQLGQDNVAQRMYILWITELLLVYSKNAPSIEIEIGSDDARTGADRGIAFVVVAKFSICLLLSLVPAT